MSTETKVRLALLALALLLTALLTLLLRDVAREVIAIPLLYLLWVAELFFSFIPQALLWVLLITTGLAIAVRSMSRQRERRRRARRGQTIYPGRVQTLLRWIQHAPKGIYFKRRLAQHLARLAAGTQLHHGRRTLKQLSQQLESLDAPPEVRAYLQAGVAPMVPGSYSLLSQLARRLRLRESTSPLDLDPENAVRFLEQQLGVRHPLEVQLHDDD